jgi:hypothetical protein
MSSNVPINQLSGITAPTPQNTPLTHAPIAGGLSRPTVPDISEDAEPAEEAANVHDAVFGLVQGRLAGLLGKSSGYIEGLPDGAKKTIEALKGVQVKQNELQNQYKRECLELEKKVSRPWFRPFYPFMYIHPPPLLPLLSDRQLLRGPNNAIHPLWVVEELSRFFCTFTPSQSFLIRNREMIDGRFSTHSLSRILCRNSFASRWHSPLLAHPL